MSLLIAAGEQPRAGAAAHAHVHAQAFVSPDSGPAAWSEATFQSMRDMDGLLWVEASDDALLGFALFRSAADEADLLTIARDPVAAGAGVGRQLLDAGLLSLKQSGVRQVFLEVARRNAPARKLYAQFGFTDVGERKRYYHTCDGHFDDALILSLNLHSS